MTYLDAAKGYIADVPEIVFYRCDQKVFHFNELTSFHFETKNDPIVIRCGHSRHPVAFIDALKEMNMEFESAAITSDLFAMSASRVTQKAEFSSLESKRYTVNQNNQIILPFLVKRSLHSTQATLARTMMCAWRTNALSKTQKL